MLFLAPGLLTPGLLAIPNSTLNNGVQMPMLSLGTWQYSSSTAESTVSLGLKLGFNHIDTANDYNNQVGVGKALAAYSRDSYFLTTKVPSAPSDSRSYAETVKYLQQDLDQLGLKYVDLVLIHFPPTGNVAHCGAMKEAWRAMEDFYKAGKARAIGVSNYCISSFECILPSATVVPAVNQVEYHVGMGVDPAGLKSYCDSKGIVLQAYSPLGDGTDELITGDLVSGIGAAHNKTGAQVSLRWVLENGVPLSTKSTSEKHLKEDLEIVWPEPLATDEKSTLDAAVSPSGKPSFKCTK